MVGIENTNRYRDLLPQKSDGSPTGIDNFIGFFIEELIPFIENNYRIKDYRIIMGPQAGANFVIYTMFEKPNLFHACIINNPFRWRGGRDIIMQEAESFFESNKTYNKFLYITYNDSDPLEIEGIGYIEKYPYSANGCWRLGNISQRSGNLQQAREYYRKVLEVHPNDVDIVRSRLSMIERKINESVAYAIEQVIKESGIKAGLDKYREIKTNKQVKLYFDEGEFNEFGYRLLNINSIEEAIEIFGLNVEMYPESANVYNSLGEAYMKDGQKDLAIKNYRKSLKLNPENDNARKMLKKLCEKNE